MVLFLMLMMNYFTDYVTWVRETQSSLDDAWLQSQKFKPDSPESLFGKSMDDILGRVRAIHPSTDNGRFYVDLNLEDSIALLSQCGWTVESYTLNKVVSGLKSGDIISDYYRLIHNEGLMSCQLFNSPADLLFYSGGLENLPQRFTSKKQAEYLGKIPLERLPDHSFGVKTSWPINPYGAQWIGGSERDKRRIMENVVIQLMERMIEGHIPAFYQNYIGFSCVINPCV